MQAEHALGRIYDTLTNEIKHDKSQQGIVLCQQNEWKTYYDSM